MARAERTLVAAVRGPVLLARAGLIIGPHDPVPRLGWTLQRLAGMMTLEGLLEVCREVTGSDAELVPVPDDALLAAGVEPWTHLPLWLPELAATAWDVATDRARATGLTRRSVRESVAGTWEWLQTQPGPPTPPRGLPLPGLPPELEARLLA